MREQVSTFFPGRTLLVEAVVIGYLWQADKGNSRLLARKAKRAMETNETGTYFQQGDYVRIKSTGKQGKIHATDGGVVYVLMDETNEASLFSAYVDEDAYIELVVPEAEQTLPPKANVRGEEM